MPKELPLSVADVRRKITQRRQEHNRYLAHIADAATDQQSPPDATAATAPRRAEPVHRAHRVNPPT